MNARIIATGLFIALLASVSTALYFSYGMETEPATTPTTVPADLESMALPNDYSGEVDIHDSEWSPSVQLRAYPDSVHGWNVEVVTQNFRFYPVHAGMQHVPGEGHALLYVDDVPVARVYNRWHHLPPLPSGDHAFRVVLHTNDHRTLTRNGRTISGTLLVTEQ